MTKNGQRHAHKYQQRCERLINRLTSTLPNRLTDEEMN